MLESPFHDPEARPSLGRALAHLPWILARILRGRHYRGGWLPDYLLRQQRFDRQRLPAGRPIDVIVLFADHFEPARRFGDEAAVESVRTWCAAYEQLASKHRDADGRPPQHTWFYRYDYPNPGCLEALSRCVFHGFGEVEFHLHHGYDTAESMAATLRSGLDWFGRYGAMRTAEANPRHLFGYVAGNSALDNGAGNDALSGCDTEVRILAEAGCYGDFTFPALGSPAQPRMTNAIYYATEDGQPKSYTSGVPLAVGRPASGDLFLLQGPLVIDWRTGYLDDGALEDDCPAHPRRLGAWLSANVHVAGRPEWVFVKLHTHAMQNRASFLGPHSDSTFSAMEEWWNRPPFRLHYVTAREACNIARAAEAGHSGNPDDYRDFLVPPPANRLICCDAPWRLISHTPQRTHVELLQPGPARLEFARGDVALVSGRLRQVEILSPPGEAAEVRVEADGPVEVVRREDLADLARALLDTKGRDFYSTSLRCGGPEETRPSRHRR
jgi:hypothetical protein